MKKINVFGTTVDAGTMQETVHEIDKRIQARQFTQHVVVNVAKVVNMKRDPVLRKSVESCDVINIDGMGVVWGARFLGKNVPERVAGVDLFHELISLSEKRDYPVFLLGATEAVVERTKNKLLDQHPDLPLAGYHHGYFWDDEKAVVDKIRESGARLLFVAITSPRKENFIDKWFSELNVDFVMGVGGTFDVVAGKVKRAPSWMQRSGLEWLYRVIQEPRRMWKRYLVTNTRFLLMLLNQKFINLVGGESNTSSINRP